MNLLMVILNEV